MGPAKSTAIKQHSRKNQEKNKISIFYHHETLLCALVVITKNEKENYTAKEFLREKIIIKHSHTQTHTLLKKEYI